MRAPTACKRTVSGSLSLPCSGCFPPFPHGTGPLSVFRECLALRDGPRGLGQDSSCPALLRWSTRNSPVACTGVSPSAPTVSTVFQFLTDSLCRLLRPRNVRKRSGLGSAPFARHYSGYRFFLSLPPGTKMFQFPGFAPSIDGSGSSNHWVAPFGYPRINSCLQIPAAFRSLPRPSSPPDSLGILRSLFLPFSVFATPFLRYPRRPAPLASSQHNGCSGARSLGALISRENPRQIV